MTYEPCQVPMHDHACQEIFLVTLFTQKGRMVSLIKIMNFKFNIPFSLGNLWGSVKPLHITFYYANVHTLIVILTNTIM